MATNQEDLITSCVAVINFIKSINSCSDLKIFLYNLNNLLNEKEQQQPLITGKFPKTQLEIALKDSSCQGKISKELLIACSQEFSYAKKDFSFPLVYEVIACLDITVVFIGIIEDAFINTKSSKRPHTNYETVAAKCLCFLIENKKLSSLIWKQCLELPVHVINGKPIYSPSTSMQWDHLMKTIVGLPDYVANKLKFKTNSIFLPSNYFTAVANGITYALVNLHDSLQNSKDCSLNFISQLIAKICFRGYADSLYEKLLPLFLKWVKESPLWCRICAKLMLSVHDNSLEFVIVPLLKYTECLDLLPLLLDNEILKRPKLKFLMAHKLLLIKSFNDETIPYNVLNYLSGHPKREQVFKESLFKLLKVWGDHGSMKNISYNQHLYLSKCILMSLSFLTQKQRTEWKQELTMKLLSSVQSHLESASDKLRVIGMVVAECITTAIDHNDGKQLNFELERTADLNFLYELATNPLSAIRSKKQQQSVVTSPVTRTTPAEPENTGEGKTGVSEHKVTSHDNFNEEEKDEKAELDSDDELEPINVRDGVEEADEKDDSVNGVQPPVYLRDCIAGLLSSKDPDRLEACLNVVEKLVKKEPGDLHDVAIDLLRILLHLEDEYSITDFYELRMDAMATITTKCPSIASEYLCGQFFEENYSTSQRLDLLEVISKSVTILSRPESDDPEEFRTHLPLPTLPTMQREVDGGKMEWQKIVDERVKAKTKRFVSGKRVAIPSNENRLTEVVGLFFFPLLKQFGLNRSGCEILMTDAMLLGKYIYTLAVVMKSAEGLMVAANMGKALLDFIWSLKYHKEAFVRQALVFALSKILLHVPTFVLMNELQREIVEAKEWLQELVEKDPDAECQKLAISCYMLLEKTFRQELLRDT